MWVKCSLFPRERKQYFHRMSRPDAAGYNRWLQPAGWLWALSLFLVGFAARLWLIQRCGSPLPIWDQWEDARVFLLPFFEGRLSLADLFSVHNDHRIFFHRVYSLALVLLNRQWDSQLLMVGQAFLHCATLTGLGWLMSRWVQARYWIWLWLPLVAVLALPFGWENSLSGFQSFFYFAVAFSLLTLWLLGTHSPGSVPWWCGAVAATMVLFTLSSGFLSAVAVFGLVVFRILRRPSCWKRQAPTLAICIAVSVAGVLLLVDVKHHHVFRAQSVVEFLLAFANNLAWPWIVVPPLAILNLAPLALLAWRYFRANEDHRAEELTLALGFWAIVLGAAAAYARGVEGRGPGWRHMEFSSFLLVANCFSIALLLSRYWPATRRTKNQSSGIRSLASAITHPRSAVFWPRRSLLVAVFAVWGLACIMGLILLNLRAWRIDIPERELCQRAQLKHARAFLATDDVRVFDHKPRTQLLAYQGDPLAPPLRYDAEWAVGYLRNPLVQRILPACARPPLEVKVNREVTHGFTTNGFRLAKREPPTEVCWGSWSAPHQEARATFESLPIRKSHLPYLEIAVAGWLGGDDMSLELVEMGAGRRSSVKPARIPGGRWLNCYVKAPAGEFRIAAKDANETSWFAFKPPRELGRLSFWAIRVLSAWSYLLFAGLGLFLFNLAALLHTSRALREP